MKIRVVFFQRKRPTNFFSIEQVFDEVRANQPEEIVPIVKELRFRSSGLINRIYGCVESYINQGDVNHITGDIHFIAPFLSKKRTILTVHDIGFMDSDSARGISRFIYKWFWIKIPLSHVKCVTTVSQATKMELIKYSGINPSKVIVIYNPISPLFKFNNKIFNKLKPLILQVGITPNKNITRLITALKEIPCKLAVLGKLPDECKNLLLEYKIEWEEYINLTTEEVFELYTKIDLLAFVSTLEGFGLPIIEANAVGRAVITSNISSMPEIAGNAAHLVDPFDVRSIRSGLQKVINDDFYRDGLVANGLRNVKRFEAVNIAQEYASLYKNLFARSLDNY